MSSEFPKRIGLFGGSFDPPHIGHVALVEAALQELQLSAVWVIPAGRPVHRTLSHSATPRMRLEWMQRIFAGHAGVKVLDWEVMQAEAMPSIATLHRFAREYPDERAVLLLGADAFAGMDGWVDYPDHADLCDVAVFGRVDCVRPGTVAAFRRQPLAEWLIATDGCGWRVDVDVSLPDVSATAIRSMAGKMESLAGRVPECVRPEIEQAYAGSAVCSRSECE